MPIQPIHGRGLTFLQCQDGVGKALSKGLLDRPAPLNDTDQNDHDGHNEQDVYESSQCVGSDESQEPENQ